MTPHAMPQTRKTESKQKNLDENKLYLENSRHSRSCTSDYNRTYGITNASDETNSAYGQVTNGNAQTNPKLIVRISKKRLKLDTPLSCHSSP